MSNVPMYAFTFVSSVSLIIRLELIISDQNLFINLLISKRIYYYIHLITKMLKKKLQCIKNGTLCE